MGLGWPAKIQWLVNGRAENRSWAHAIDQPEPSPSCHPVYDCPLQSPVSVGAALSALARWVFFNIEHESLVANSDHGKCSIEPACVHLPHGVSIEQAGHELYTHGTASNCPSSLECHPISLHPLGLGLWRVFSSSLASRPAGPWVIGFLISTPSATSLTSSSTVFPITHSKLASKLFLNSEHPRGLGPWHLAPSSPMN